jgi:hypothetical protein
VAQRAILIGRKFSVSFPQRRLALIYLNQSLLTVPMCYQNRRFIVQSSSLRPDRFSWRDKVNRIVFLYRMKLWPLSELLLGYIPVGIILIEFALYSQPNIAAHFYKHFRSSARSAYANASFAAQYDTNFIRNRCTRASASHMLEDGIHNIFRRVANYPHCCKRPGSEMYILEDT